MTEWKKYEGTYEQIAEMMSAYRGFVLRYADGKESLPYYGDTIPIDEILDNWGEFTHYLICNPHPLADMIIRQAQTGQSVWIYITVGSEDGDDIEYLRPTNKPDWNIPAAVYSFTPFED